MYITNLIVSFVQYIISDLIIGEIRLTIDVGDTEGGVATNVALVGKVVIIKPNHVRPDLENA